MQHDESADVCSFRDGLPPQLPDQVTSLTVEEGDVLIDLVSEGRAELLDILPHFLFRVLLLCTLVVYAYKACSVVEVLAAQCAGTHPPQVVNAHPVKVVAWTVVLSSI